MPTYAFKHKEAGEVKEVFLKLSELDNYKSENPEYERVIVAGSVSIVDPWALGLLKPPSDFQRYVIKRMEDANPGMRKSKWGTPREF